MRSVFSLNNMEADKIVVARMTHNREDNTTVKHQQEMLRLDSTCKCTVEKSCVAFLLCDLGWCVHKSDVQNKWDVNTHTQRERERERERYFCIFAVNSTIHQFVSCTSSSIIF